MLKIMKDNGRCYDMRHILPMSTHVHLMLKYFEGFETFASWAGN